MLLLRQLHFTLILSISAFACQAKNSQQEISVAVSDDVDLIVNIFKPQKTSDYLLLWLAPEYGFRKGHHQMAQLLNEQQIEVWQADIVESLFMPPGIKSIRQLSGQYIAELIEYAHQSTAKKIIITGDSYAAVSALIGAHQWQSKQQPDAYLIGALLFSPSSYASVPPLGLDPEYMPIMDATNIPIALYQTQKSGNINQFKTVLNKLQQHDNAVYVKMIPEIMSLFYSEQPIPLIQQQRQTLAPNIRKLLPLLEKHSVPEKPVLLTNTNSNKNGIDIYLKKYKGQNQPLSINLLDANDQSFIKNDFTGKVTVINFWATWCPPCVEEIPSLNRLKKKMQDRPFELISINYAENKQTILNFLNNVNVEYPVLMDTNGEFAKQWHVITYPSTFIINTQGKIVYGVNSAIAWDDPQLIEMLRALY